VDQNNGRVDGFCIVQPAVTPATRSVVDGASVTFTVDPGCAWALRYQWLKDSIRLTDGGGVSGATQAVLTLAGVAAADSGNYAVEVSIATGTATSDPARLTVIVRPAIVRGPADGTAAAGADVTFSVVATGSAPLLYQWSHNGVPLAGENRSDLVLAKVSAAANGVYTVRVSNAAGEASASARFAVAEAPTLSARLAPGAEPALSWTNPFYVLESAPAVAGPWAILSRVSPFAVPADAIARTAEQYYRLVRE
jgi:hypothetical protein